MTKSSLRFLKNNMIILALIIIIGTSIALAIKSLKSLESSRELENVRGSLKKGRTIYQSDSVSSSSVGES